MPEEIGAGGARVGPRSARAVPSRCSRMLHRRPVSSAFFMCPGILALFRGARAGCFDVVIAVALDSLLRGQSDMAAMCERLSLAASRVAASADDQVGEMLIGWRAQRTRSGAPPHPRQSYGAGRLRMRSVRRPCPADRRARDLGHGQGPGRTPRSGAGASCPWTTPPASAPARRCAGGTTCSPGFRSVAAAAVAHCGRFGPAAAPTPRRRARPSTPVSLASSSAPPRRPSSVRFGTS